MRTISALAVLVSTALVLAGCGATSETEKLSSSGDAPASGSKLAGNYKGKVQPSGDKDDPAAKMAESMMDMFAMELEITADNKYTLSMIGIPMTGSVTQTGNDVTLTPEKIMGMSPEEFQKSMAASNPGAKAPDMTPMKGTVDASGKIVIKDPKQDTNIAFERVAAKKVGTSTVTADETKYVGAYAARIDEKKLKPEEKAMAGMASFMSLNLEADNTFAMKMGMSVNGKWKLEGDKITLIADQKDGFSTKDGKNPQFQVAKDGSLIPIDEKGDAPFVFYKK